MPPGGWLFGSSQRASPEAYSTHYFMTRSYPTTRWNPEKIAKLKKLIKYWFKDIATLITKFFLRQCLIFLFSTLLPMTVRFWYRLVAKWPCKPTHFNWINLSLALQGQLWRPRKSGRRLIKHLEAIPLGYLKHTSFWVMTNVASRRGTQEKPQKMLWAPIGEVFCIPLRLVFYSNTPMESVP